MTHQQSAEEIRTIKGARRIAVWAIIVSLVITATIGIFSLVTGSFDETRTKIMLTTLAVAAFSVLSLCHLAAFGRDIKIVGWLGISTSAVALIASVTLIWWDWSDTMFMPSDLYMSITKTFAVATLISVSFAHANLMLMLANAPIAWVRIALMVNLALIALVPVFVIPAILTDGQFPPASFQESYWRFFGVLLILDALGTIALPVTTLIFRAQRGHVATSGKNDFSVSLAAVDATWVKSRAKADGVSTSTVIANAVSAARKQK
jgi:hypothetical protein